MREIQQHGPFLGLGLYWAWVAVVFYSDALVPPAFDADALVEQLWLWATWSHMLGLLVIAALSRRAGSLVARRWLCAASAAACALGSAALPLALSLLDPAGAACLAVVIASAALVGVGGALHVLQWAELYADGLGPAVVAPSVLSFAFGLAAYFALLAFPPRIVTAMAALLPLLAGLAMGACRSRAAVSASTARTCREGAPPAGAAGGLALSVAAIFAFAFCGEMLRMFSLRITGAGVDAMGALYLAGGLMGLAVLGAFVLLPRSRDRGRRISLALVRNVLLLMAAAFLIAPFLDGRTLPLAYGVFGAGFWCFRAISWVVCLMVAARFGYAPVRVVAVLDGAFALSVVVSGQLNLWLAESIKVGLIELTAVSLVAVFALMATVVFVLNGKGVGALLREGPDVPRGEESGPGADGRDAPGRGERDVDAAVERIARDYGLSPREREVAALLAKGRSLPFVQSELYISAGTAQTHASHIYRKLDVHSRQEFLDVVEGRIAGAPRDGGR